MARANNFQREVSKLLKETFPVAERLDDAAKNRGGGYQVSKKPWDFYGCTRYGNFWVAEAKRVKTHRFSVTSGLADHQREALKKVEELNGNSWLFINWRVALEGCNQTGVAIWVTYSRYRMMETEVLAEGVKSLTPDDFNDAWRLDRISGGWAVPVLHPIYATVC